MLEFWLAVHYIAVLLKVAFLNEDLEKQARALTLPPQSSKSTENLLEEPQVEEVFLVQEKQQLQHQTSTQHQQPYRPPTPQGQSKYRYSFKGYSESCLYIVKSKGKKKGKKGLDKHRKKKKVPTVGEKEEEMQVQQQHQQQYHHQQVYTTGPTRADKMSAAWSNKAEEIVRAEVGLDEFNRRSERQKKLFEQGCKKGGFTDSMSVYFSKGDIKSLCEKKTKETAKRATHSTGIGAQGYVIIDNDARLPENDFFAPDRVFEIRARHSNTPHSEDDCKNGARSLSIKFADHDKESPLDFIMQTGRISSMFNADAVEESIQSYQKGNEAVKKHMLSLPIYLEATLEGMRRLPTSYYHQHYYAQMTYDFKAKDDKRRLARFRIVPGDGSPESGRLTAQQQREAWYQLLLDRVEEARSPRYLKEEFASRLIDANMEYKLQVQLHDWEQGDTNMLYNPAVMWSDEQHPWINVGSINLTSLLPDHVTENTRFNIGNHPKDTISYPEGTSVTDFNIVPTLREEIYNVCQRIRPTEPENIPSQESAVYLLHVVTGDRVNAGMTESKCEIFISIIGRDGRTAFRKLEKKTKNDFAAGAKTTFRFTDRQVGEFVCAKVYKEKKGVKTDWYLESIILTSPYNNRCYTLPCYRWFTDETPIIALRDGVALTDAQEEDHYMRLLRSFEVAEKQRLYRWRDRKEDTEEMRGLMGWSDAGDDTNALHKDLRLADDKKVEQDWNRHLKDANSIIRQLKNLLKTKQKKTEAECEALLDDIAENKSFALAHIIRNWKNDEEFARQIMNGLNPNKIREMRELPEDFLIQEETLDGLLDPGKSLEEEMEEGKMFIVSYPELNDYSFYGEPGEEYPPPTTTAKEADTNSIASDGGGDTDSVGGDSISSTEGEKKDDKKKSSSSSSSSKKKKGKKPTVRYLCAPTCLFYNRGGRVVPLAIQLMPPDEDGQAVIFTPNDNVGEFSDWLLAKMWVRVADANVHQYSVHLLGTHMLLEPIALACVRNLPSVHPIAKLLFPHLKTIMAVNTVYRKAVMPDGGALTEVMALGQRPGDHISFINRQYQHFRLPLLYLPDNFIERGVLEEEVLPGYYFRDDSLKIWEAITDFVTEIVSIYYADDEEVEKDDELAAMLLDLRVNGFHVRADVSERFYSMEELVKFCTIAIFRASAQHHAVNAGQLEIYAFVPNAPPCFMAPPPRSKRQGGWTEDDLRDILPPSELAERYIALAHMFSKISDNMIPLGEYPERLFTEERPKAAIKAFHKRLGEIQVEIEQRKKKKVPTATLR